MIYKNAELFNVGALLPGEDAGSVRWLRVPQGVYDGLDSEQGRSVCRGCTGVELRFVMESDTVTLRMRTWGKNGLFHVYRGSIQGSWEDHESNKILSDRWEDYVIKRSDNIDTLRRMTADFSMPFSPEVVRVIFDRGSIELADIIGSIRPPRKDELPKKTLLAYGSSITHGSNALDISHSWAAVLAHSLHMDCRNLGMAGSCHMEPSVVEYIAKEGKKGAWDIALLELGINVLGWETERAAAAVGYTLDRIAGENRGKKIYLISPFYSNNDYYRLGDGDRWREMMERLVKERRDPNVTYFDGLSLLGNMSFLSADEIHPNIYGVQEIADRLKNLIGRDLTENASLT